MSSHSRPVVDVLEVEPRPIDRSRARGAADTCHRPVIPGFIESRRRVPVLVPGDVVERVRPRADEAHLAAEDVPQLRQLVDARLAAGSGRARVTRGSSVILNAAPPGPRCGPGGPARSASASVAHRPELHDRERAARQAGALLPEEHRSTVVEGDRDRAPASTGDRTTRPTAAPATSTRRFTAIASGRRVTGERARSTSGTTSAVRPAVPASGPASSTNVAPGLTADAHPVHGVQGSPVPGHPALVRTAYSPAPRGNQKGERRSRFGRVQFRLLT